MRVRSASAKLNVASSAISRQILKVEAELGASIFERHPTGLRLTSAGEILFRHARLTLSDFDRIRSEIDALEAGFVARSSSRLRGALAAAVRSGSGGLLTGDDSSHYDPFRPISYAFILFRALRLPLQKSEIHRLHRNGWQRSCLFEGAPVRSAHQDFQAMR